jgi:GNAT superfamily N-acetyltransferase
MEHIVTRELKAPEMEDLLALYTDLHKKDDPQPDPATLTATWQEMVGNPALHCLGCFVDDVLVASCVLCIVPNMSRGCRPYALIENVVTKLEHRRRGYGRQVVEYAVQKAWQAGCYKVMLLSGRRSEGVIRFYESIGFDRKAKQAFVITAPATGVFPMENGTES